jgi:predicted amidohydrolase
VTKRPETGAVEDAVGALEPPAALARRELTVAGFQMVISSDDIGANERAIHRAIDRAADVKADFLLTPEASLSGYHADFSAELVAQAEQRLADHARAAKVGLLLGTCQKEMGTDFEFPFRMHANPIVRFGARAFCYNQIRIYAPDGAFLGAHSKIQLVSSLRHPGIGEPTAFTPGRLRIFSWNGIRFGALICNDLWGGQFASTPNNLAARLWEMGAQIIFHAVYSGFGRPNPSYPGSLYYEACLARCAAELGMPIVTVNAADAIMPVNSRSGVWSPAGDCEASADDVGEQFFSYTLPIPT